ncbi:MAG: MBL fold metallo-hydrolase [Acidimicrobiales bacterium]
MRLGLLGVRGSTPAPGIEFDRYGGHTSSVAVARDGEAPTLVLDAGTGLRMLPLLLGDAPFAGAIVLGHLHWDHTMGLPFCRSVNHPGSRVDLWVPAQGDIEAILERSMSPPHFPITPGQLRGRWTFAGLEEGTHQIAGFEVLAREIPHKGGRAFGYRVSDGRSSFAYLSDHCPTALGPGPSGLGELHPAAMALAQDCDLLIHDAQYLDEELAARANFGHSSAGYAVELGVAASVKRVLLFHHDPPRTDDQIDGILERYSDAEVPVDAARQGSVIDLGTGEGAGRPMGLG